MKKNNNHELIDFLLRTKFFSSLSYKQAKKLLDCCEQQFLSPNELLCQKGEASDSMFVLVKGQLVAFIPKDKKDHVVGIIKTGEVIGELGVFTGKPRALSIRAYSEAQLLVLKTEHLHQYLNKYATTDLWLELLKTTIDRSQNLIKLLAQEKICRHVVFIPATDKPISHKLITQVKKQVNQADFIQVIDTEYLEQHYPSRDIELIATIIQEAEKSHTTLLFIFDNIGAILPYIQQLQRNEAKIIFENIDAIYVIAHHDDPPKLNEYIKTIFDVKFLPFVSRKAFIMLHDSQSNLPSGNTLSWLNQADFNQYHHIRYDNTTDINRLCRFIVGKPNGLVLSGGGSKGWASLGVIKAIKELGIPIDIIAGTSVGSILSTLWSIYQEYDKVKQASLLISKAFDKLFSIGNLSYPIISINNGKKFTEALIKTFGDLNIEDLWLPNFNIACNLNTGEEVIQKHGLAWQAVRSSCSLPLIFPPVVIDGQLHLDGGLLNNLPIDHMRQVTGTQSFIIGVDLGTTYFDKSYHFPPVIPFTTALGISLKIKHQDYVYPPLLETFLNALLIGSSSKKNNNILMADMVLKPDVKRFPMTGVKKNQIETLIEIGYQHALNKLQQIAIDRKTGIILTGMKE